MEKLPANAPRFETPLPKERDFNYWSTRFQGRQQEYEAAVEQRNNIAVRLPSKPVTINFVGDLHVGSPRTDYQRIDREIGAICRKRQSYVMLMGDLVDGYFWGKQAQMQQSEQAPEQFAYQRSLIEKLAAKRKIIVGWGGDHDLWTANGGLDPYATFARDAKAHYMHGMGYVRLGVGRQEYKIAGAHRLPGHSMYNKVHPGMRANIQSARGADVIVHGHTHQKGYARQGVTQFGGESQDTHFVSIGPYKQFDEYANKGGLAPIAHDVSQMYGSAIRLQPGRHHIQYFHDILEANK